MNEQVKSQGLGQSVALPETKISFKDIALTDGSQGVSQLMPRNFGEVVAFSELMARADCAIRPHFRNNPGACMAVAMRAMRWQMDPFQVADKSYFVNDQLAFEAQLIAAVVISQAPIAALPEYTFAGEGMSRKCICSIKMKDGSTKTYESPELAKVKKKSPLWVDDPDQQLCYYSIRAWARRHSPHTILGAYTPDEIREFEPVRAIKAADDQGADLARRLASHAKAGAAPDRAFDATFVDGELNATSGGDAKVVSGPASVRGNGIAESGADLLPLAREEALEGRRSFDAWYARLEPDQIEDLKPHMASLMQAANLVQHGASSEASKIIEHDAAAGKVIEAEAVDEPVEAQAPAFDFDAELEAFTKMLATFVTGKELEAFAQDLTKDTASWYCLAPAHIRTDARERFADAQDDMKKYLAAEKLKADRAAAKAAKDADKAAQAAKAAAEAAKPAQAAPVAAVAPEVAPELAALLAEGDTAAKDGVRAFKRWRGRLNQKNYDAVADRFAGWEAAARAADEAL